MTDNALRTFIEAAESWVCDGYALDIRYLADTRSEPALIWHASVHLNPLPPDRDNRLRIDSTGICIGQIQLHPERKVSLLQVLRDAAAGSLPLAKCRLHVTAEQPVDHYSEMGARDRWFAQLHLQVRGARRPPPSTLELAAIDNALRAANPPFDGLQDASTWLSLPAPGSSDSPSITIMVGPPADLITDSCRLTNDELTLRIHAHPKFDVRQVSLAVRSVPGNGLAARLQIADAITWKRVRNGLREGIVKISVANADQALAVLLIGGAMVRRHWFIDPTKARNNRLLAAQHFDRDLRMIRSAVFESTDSARFETGIAALLFLLGFTPSVQLETDAPDLIVTTPAGRLALVECTTRVADFGIKLGKLVDRRGALVNALASSGHPAEIAAVLVCRLPKSQIAAKMEELRTHRVVLLTGDDLASFFDGLRFPSDPDRILGNALAALQPHLLGETRT